MRKLLLLLLVVLVALVAAACGENLTSRVSEGGEQLCPAWAGYADVAMCDIKVRKTDVSSCEDIDMTDWDKMRITIIGEVLFDNGENIVVRRDSGEEIDYVNQRIYAGTYVVEKTDEAPLAGFRITNPYAYETVISISAEFVRPVE